MNTFTLGMLAEIHIHSLINRHEDGRNARPGVSQRRESTCRSRAVTR